MLLGCVGLIFTSLYVQWTKVAADIIEGVQGRYFIPISLLFFLICSPFKKYSKKLSSTKIYNNLFLCLIFVNIYVLFLIVCFFC